MKSRWAFVLVPLLAILIGCGDVYRVRVHNAASPSGIPFYSSSGACTQETVYANPYYLVTLKVSGPSGVLLSDSVKLSNRGHKSSDFSELTKELEKPQPDFGTVEAAWILLKQRQAFDPYTESEGQFLLRNASKLTTVVDYGHPYSLNERKPLAGSVSADYKLNPDGTLGEAQGQVQEDTLSTILSALPLGDLIKSAAGIATKTGAAAGQPPEPVHFSLEQEERMRTMTYSRTISYVANCPTGSALVASDGISTSVADIGAKDVSGKADGVKDDSSIGISGTISLPKGLLPKPSKSDGTGSGAAQSGDSSKTSGKGTGQKKDSGKKPGTSGKG
jgi:hypothetical protein